MLRIVRRLNEPPIVNRVAFELWIMIASLVAGTSMLLVLDSPSSVDNYLDSWAEFLWEVSLIIAPLILIYSLLKKDRLAGLLLEIFTLIPFGIILLVYAVVAPLVAGQNAAYAAFMTGSMGLSCLTTAWLIRKGLKERGLWIRKP